jgi:hypothetical protein
MMSDTDLVTLQRTIASNKAKQVEEIASRDRKIADLSLQLANVTAAAAKQQDQYAHIKESLAKMMHEMDLRTAAVEAERERAAKAVLRCDVAESEAALHRQERDAARQLLATAESLASASSHQRQQLAELENALVHARDQNRLLHEGKAAVDAQVLLTIQVRPLLARPTWLAPPSHTPHAAGVGDEQGGSGILGSPRRRLDA